MTLSIFTLPITLGVPVAGRGFILSTEAVNNLPQQFLGPHAVRMVATHDHTTPPYGKMRRVINVQVEEKGEATILWHDIEMEYAEFSRISSYYRFTFTHDSRPFLPLGHYDGFEIDAADFNIPSAKEFTSQVQEILPNVPVHMGERRGIDPMAVLGICGSIAAAAIALRQFPFIGPMVREAEEGVVAGLDIKGRVSRAIQSFINTSDATQHRVETHLRVSEHLMVTFISDANDTPEALEIANQVVSNDADFMQDATEVVYLYDDGNWHFQYKSLKNGDVLVSSECFHRWVNLLESIAEFSRNRQQNQ